jgi:hypothetical protein
MYIGCTQEGVSQTWFKFSQLVNSLESTPVSKAALDCMQTFVIPNLEKKWITNFQSPLGRHQVEAGDLQNDDLNNSAKKSLQKCEELRNARISFEVEDIEVWLAAAPNQSQDINWSRPLHQVMHHLIHELFLFTKLGENSNCLNTLDQIIGPKLDFLLDVGADVNLLDSKERTPLDIVLQHILDIHKDIFFDEDKDSIFDIERRKSILLEVHKRILNVCEKLVKADAKSNCIDFKTVFESPYWASSRFQLRDKLIQLLSSL